jgi:hypothetical protein
VLPGAVRERPRVGAGPDHRVVGALRLPARPSRPGKGRRRPGRAHGSVLQRRTELVFGRTQRTSNDHAPGTYAMLFVNHVEDHDIGDRYLPVCRMVEFHRDLISEFREIVSW